MKPCVHASDMYPKENHIDAQHVTFYGYFIPYSPMNYCHPTVFIFDLQKIYVGDWVDIAKSLWVVVAIFSQQRITM